MRVNTAIFGATGGVGRELVRQIADKDVWETKGHENPTVVVALADSQHVAIEPGGYSQELLRRFADTRGALKVADLGSAVSLGSEGMLAVPAKMRELGFTNDILYVDVTSAREASRDLHLNVIGGGGKVVTANKNPIGLYGQDVYERLTADPRLYKYSATFMAGLLSDWLSRKTTNREQAQEFKASLSGTVGFITDALSKGIKLSAAIKSAQAAGYTETDWGDDLNGLDVGRKLVILAREAGAKIHFQDIKLEPFLPQKYLGIANPETRLRAIAEEYDDQIAARYAEAAERGMTLKYLATFKRQDGRVQLTVGLEEVPIDSAFGRLTGTDNRIEVINERYTSERPYKLEGPGAGRDITASNVRDDIAQIQDHISRF